MISVKYRSERSQHNFSLDVLKSALQKYIRRGNVKMACYALSECLSFRKMLSTHAKDVKRINTNIFHRLQIIALEDVGPTVLPFLETHAKRIDPCKDVEANIEETLHSCAMFINGLCSLPKSRSGSWYKAYYCSKEAEEKVISRDDKECEELCKKYIRCEPSQVKCISNLVLCCKEYNVDAIYFAFKLFSEKEKLVFDVLKSVLVPDTFRKMIDITYAWYKDLKNVKEAFLTWCIPLLFVCEKRNMTQYDDSFASFEEHLEWLYKNKEKTLVFDEWVYDMHTKDGRKDKIRKNTLYFALESSKVYPEDPLANTTMRQFYIRSKGITEVQEEKKEEERVEEDIYHAVKKACEGKDSEKECFQSPVRVQLVTSRSKTDTYYATVQTDLGPQTVFVKGPLQRCETIHSMIAKNEKKRALGLSYIWMFPIECKPDLFDLKTVALGQRCSCKPDKKAWFIVCQDICEWQQESIPTVIKSSKCWQPTPVVDFTNRHIRQFQSEDLSNKTLALEYFKCLLFRHFYNVSDQADRNFLVDTKKNRIFSVDEDSEGEAKLTSLCKSRKKACIEFLETNKKEAFDCFKQVFATEMKDMEDIEDILHLFQS